MAIPPEYRFIEKFVLGPDSCWLWTAETNRGGYGLFRITRKSHVGAHRFSYQLLVGPIPAGLQLDHLCRVRNCVNPAHLEPVTPKENYRRGLKGSLYTHCKHGHEMTEDNTIRGNYGARGEYRKCRICQLAANRRAYRRAREIETS
jgi:hypothetical protein